MAKYKRIVTTEAGLALLAKAYESEMKITFTAVRTGNGTYNGTENLSGMKALKSVKHSFGLSGVSRTGAQVKVRSVLSNDGVTAGYNITEIGLYAKDPDSAEILYAIIVAETGLEDYLPPFEETPTSITLEMYIAIAEEQSKVTFAAEIVAGTYVAVEDFQDHVASTVHITAAERTNWNAKASEKDFQSHVSSSVHITAAERTAWNSAKDTYATIRQNTSSKELSLNEINNPTDDAYGFISDVTAAAIGLPKTHFSVISRYNSGNSTQLFLPIVTMDVNPWIRNMTGTTISALFELTRREDITQYLPLAGGVISGGLGVTGSLVAYATIYVSGDVSDDYGGVMLMDAPNIANIGDVLVRPYTNGIAFYNNNEEWRGARLDMTKCGIHQSSEILHTGISIPVVPSETEPTDTTALWIDTKNLKIKKYINSTWTEL